ncbi:helix-turn-helix transcriptional regulator [Escherichia coli]|uniref:AraC family transcriptional regulator n=1 Tax=Escherichia coli TaxID=562 RepID=UPI0002CA61BF|nr:AraC family transcriptional regulator [Escherichia coli]AIF65159.1 transposase for IS629 [Escherichia coli B7A]EEW0419912.1 AraC family transcriptional regulator [Escherichia coli]EEX9685960.1 AraC family transcriptional regulator [Escherichia coli]EEZ4662452.1 helix-turn-helix transcriptional regulator [Escherichia coli]EFB1629810.1 AraC family transcriptional regulator [Escherichia coli]
MLIPHLKSDQIKMNNVRVHKYTILYTSNCIMDIDISGKTIFCNHNKFVFLERGVNLSVRIKKIDIMQKPYFVIRLHEDILLCLKNVMINIYGLSLDSHERTSENKVLISNEDSSSRELFERILKRDYNLNIIPELLYFISRQQDRRKIVESIYISSVTLFSDKIRSVIEKDLSKKWKLNIIADEFNVSEITIRKRLELENISFNQILVQARMTRAAMLILENTYQTAQISNMVGISSASYFIRLFNKHFGVTPKQFVSYFRG